MSHRGPRPAARVIARDRGPRPTGDDRRAGDVALECVEAGIEAGRPERIVREVVTVADGTLRVGANEYDLERYDELVVLGGGNAAAHVAAALAENDVAPYLAERDALIRTGPTRTNLNDLRVIVVE